MRKYGEGGFSARQNGRYYPRWKPPPARDRAEFDEMLEPPKAAFRNSKLSFSRPCAASCFCLVRIAPQVYTPFRYMSRPAHTFHIRMIGRSFGFKGRISCYLQSASLATPVHTCSHTLSVRWILNRVALRDPSGGERFIREKAPKNAIRVRRI